MAKEWAKSFYSSAAWIKCKNAYIDKRIMIDGGLCEVCHNAPGYIVHHKIMLKSDNINKPEISLNHEQLSYECKECHDEHEGHGLNKGKKLLVMFDSTGQPIPLHNESKEDKSPPI